jgi:hypothetical protein
MTSLSPSIQSVLELFKGPLSNVRFADIDAEGLARVAAEVEAVGGEVQRHEEELAMLRQTLAQRQEALLTLSQQALAYARVYAENDEQLLEELNRIALPRSTKPRKPGASNGGARATRAETGAEADAGTNARGEATEESASDGLEPASADGGSADGGSADGGSADEAGDVDGETANEPKGKTSGKAAPAQQRNGRKARGRSAQPSAG